MGGPVRLVIALFLAAVEIGGVFGSATAAVEAVDGDSMVVELVVEVHTSAGAVVAHLAFDDDPELTLPLLDRGDGTYGTTTELEAKNYQVVFEAVGVGDGLSDNHSLVELGADIDPGLGGEAGVPPPRDDTEDLAGETRRSGWLALALGAASLSTLAFWALGGRDKGDDDDGGAHGEVA